MDPQIYLAQAGIHHVSYSQYLEVRCTYKLLSNGSYNTIIARVTVGMGLMIRL